MDDYNKNTLAKIPIETTTQMLKNGKLKEAVGEFCDVVDGLFDDTNKNGDSKKENKSGK